MPPLPFILPDLYIFIRLPILPQSGRCRLLPLWFKLHSHLSCWILRRNIKLYLYCLQFRLRCLLRSCFGAVLLL
jgi:hypothetical protein